MDRVSAVITSAISWLKHNHWLVVGLCVLTFFTAGLVYVYGNFSRISVKSAVNTTSPSPSPVDNRFAHLFNQGTPYSVALLGYGGGGHDGGQLSDSIMVAYIEPKRQRVSLISVPRDTWVSLPVVEGATESYWKINAAYAIGADDGRYRQKPLQFTGEAGGGEMAKFALEKVIGIPINTFVALDFYGFTKTIATLGSVTVQVDRTFDDYYYPIKGLEKESCGRSDEEIAAVTATMSATQLEQSFTCRYEHLHFDAGKVTMDGETALKFVRSRHSLQDGGDFGRAARQRNLMVAVRDRVLSLNFLPKIIPFINTLSGSLTTDLALSDMEYLLRFQDELKNYAIVSIALTDKNVLDLARSSDGQMVLQPKQGEGQWQAVHDFVQSELASDSATATVSATR